MTDSSRKAVQHGRLAPKKGHLRCHYQKKRDEYGTGKNSTCPFGPGHLIQRSAYRVCWGCSQEHTLEGVQATGRRSS